MKVVAVERGVSPFTESVVEEATIAWLEGAGWRVRNGAEIALGEPAAERDDYGQVVRALARRETLSLMFISSKRGVRDAEQFIAEASA